VVGLSRIREKHIFGGLPVQTRWERLRCGIAVVDLRSGREAGFFEFTEGCEEIYDVQFLPGIKRPMILNLEKPATRQAISNPDSAFWLRPGNEIRDDAAQTSTLEQQLNCCPNMPNAAGTENNNIDEQNFAKLPVEGMAGPVRTTATK
jgi:hypothetical protein